MTKPGAGAVALFVLALSCATGAAVADDVADFYRGKTIVMTIGSSAGGGYDALSRAVARFLPGHIPGAPAVVTRNQPGAGGVLAAKYLYTIAPRDGTAMGLLRNLAPLEPLFGTREADYDATKFNWLGTLAVETGLVIVWRDSPFKSIEDMRAREFLSAADGVSSQPAFYSRLLNELLGTKIRVVAGYAGQNEAYLAIEQHEVDSFGVTYWSSLTSTKQEWLRDGKIRVLLQFGPVREPALKDVPYAPDMAASAEDRELFRAAYAPLTLGRPFVLPPDVPPERVAALRKAFGDMIADPRFRAEADRLGLLVDNPRTGAQLQEELERLYAMPPARLERLRALARAR